MNPEDMDAENLELSLNPLMLEDTLIPILQYFQFDGSFLKSVRCLSKLWNQVALKQFHKSNFLRVPPNPDFNSDFSSQDAKEEDRAVLSRIQEFLKRVGTIQNISISDNFSTDMKVYTSLEPQIQWEKIKQLRFNFHFQRDNYWYEEPTKDPQKISEKIQDGANFITEMMTKCPNLTFLDIPPQSDRTFSQEIGLQIMESCINLGKNENLTISNLAAAVSTDQDVKIVVGFSETGVRVINFLAKPLNQLKRDFPLQIPAVIKAFEKILESNKNSMILLGLNGRRDIFLPDFEIPENMSQLKFLHLTSDQVSQLKFNDGFQFHQNFPNLTQVNLKLYGSCETGQNHLCANIFQNQQPCHTVKKLDVMSHEQLDEEIFQVFPSIEELKFGEQPVLTLPDTFKFLQRNCKKLRILQLDVPTNMLSDRQLRLVSNLSGFPIDVVQNLVTPNKKFTSKIKDYFTSRIMRTATFSILKNLQELHFICDDDAFFQFYGKYEYNTKFLQQHVFSTVPNLKVQWWKKGDKVMTKEAEN